MIKRHIPLFFIIVFTTVFSCVSFATETQVFRDEMGRKKLTATTHGSTTIYRDAQGRLVMTAKETNGKLVYRDSMGRQVGTSTLPKKTKPKKVEAQPQSAPAEDVSQTTYEDDYQLLRDTMSQRAISRLGSADTRNTVADPKQEETVQLIEEQKGIRGEGILRGIISIPINVAMFIIIIPMAVFDYIINI